jgi:hypothetical protein
MPRAPPKTEPVRDGHGGASRTAAGLVRIVLASLVLLAEEPAASVVFVRTAEANSVAPASDAVAPLPDLRSTNTLVIGGMAAGVAAYGLAKWWDEGFTGRFTTGNEGWFGQDTSSGGADKLGHAYFANASVRVMSLVFQSYGNDPDTAARLAFWSAFGTMTAVEVADGFSKQYTFSWQDAAMNAVGAAFGWWCERYPEVDALLDFRLMYQKSQQSSSWDPAGDYSGQTYLLVGKASGVPRLRDVPMLRYVEVALGYGARSFDGPPGATPSRNVYYGLQLNLSALLNDTAFAENRWPKARRVSGTFFDLWQLRDTGVYAKSRL